MTTNHPVWPAVDAWRCWEFSPQVFDAWFKRLCDQGYCALLVGLLLKLERLLSAPLDGPRRLAVMGALVPLVGDLADDLPTAPPPAAVATGPAAQVKPTVAHEPRAAGPTLIQRLDSLSYRNLALTLQTLDQGGAALLGEHGTDRRWVVMRMFELLSRQIELGARWGRTWPPNTWQELHDLFAYCNNRLSGGRITPGDAPGAADPSQPQFDAQAAYKRLLLIGLCAEEGVGALWQSNPEGRFERWIQTSELRDASAYVGVLGACLVDQFVDAPARFVAGVLGESAGARVLKLPEDFLVAFAAARPRWKAVHTA